MRRLFKIKAIVKETSRSILAHNTLFRPKIYTDVTPSIHHVETLPALADHVSQYTNKLNTERY